jgi:hypothetical protein
MNSTTIEAYISDWVSGSHDASFYKKWALFIELVTDVRLDDSFTDLQNFAVANTCYMKVQPFSNQRQ